MSSRECSTDFSLILASVEKTAKETQANSQHSDQRTHLKDLLESLPETGLDFDIGGERFPFPWKRGDRPLADLLS